METCLRKGSGRACDACCVPFPTRALIPPAGARRRKVDGDSWPMSWRRRVQALSRPPAKLIVPPSHQQRRAACADSEPWNVNCHPQIACGRRRSRVARPSPLSVMTALATWWRLPSTVLEDASPCAPAFVINRAIDGCGMCSQDPRFITIHADSRFVRVLIATAVSYHHGSLASGVLLES